MSVLFNLFFSILLNIMFHAQIGKISVRINLLFYLFFTVVPFNTFVFLFYRPFVVNTTFSTTKGLQGRNTQVLDATTVKNR